MPLLLPSEDVVNLAVNVLGRLDLRAGNLDELLPHESRKRRRRGERGPTHRCAEVEQGLAGDEGLLVVVLDLDVDDVDGPVELTALREEVCANRKTTTSQYCVSLGERQSRRNATTHRR